MAWVELEMPLFPRTRRTADGTYYTHDGTGRAQVRAHHVAELLRGQGVRRPVPPPSPVSPPSPTSGTAAQEPQASAEDGAAQTELEGTQARRKRS